MSWTTRVPMCWAWKTALTGETVDQPWGDICDGDETQDGAGDLRTAGHLAGW
jgi:hypothetical protein